MPYVFSIAVILVFVWILFRRDLENARARVSARSQLIESANGKIEFVVEGQGEPVLVLHGAAGGWDQGLEMTAALLAHGYRIIAPSRIGYLRSSSRSNVSIAAQIEAYVEMLNHLGIASLPVIAISAGVWSAVEFAAKHPSRCRALVLLVPADRLPPGVSNYGGIWVRMMLNSDFLAWCLVKLGAWIPKFHPLLVGTDSSIIRSSSSAEQARVRRTIEHLLPLSARAQGMQFDIRTAASPTEAHLESIRCPVLAISADDDHFGTARRVREIATKIPAARSVIFPSGGHALVGRYDDALREVAAFLARGSS